MSSYNVSASHPDAASKPEQDSQQNVSEAAQRAAPNAYQAPYYHYGKDAVPGSYMVKFHLGHTIAKHFAFIGREFDLVDIGGDGYGANLNDELLNAIRQDPGVEFVEDNVAGQPEEDGEI